MRVLGLSREGRQWRRACSTRGGRGRRGIGRRRRVRAPRLDSLDEDEEGDEAELLSRFDLLGEAPGDGDAAAGAARSRPWLRVRVSVSEGKNEQGRERERAGLRRSYLHGGARQRVGWCGSDTGGRARSLQQRATGGRRDASFPEIP